MAIIRNGSNWPSTIDEVIAMLEHETVTVSGREEWGRGYKRGLRFCMTLLRKLKNKQELKKKQRIKND